MEKLILEPLKIAAAGQNIAAALWLCCRRPTVLFTASEGTSYIDLWDQFLFRIACIDLLRN
jgi:hypothetical protein